MMKIFDIRIVVETKYEDFNEYVIDDYIRVMIEAKGDLKVSDIRAREK